MNFLYGLLGLSGVFLLLERLNPWRKRQPILRKRLGQDLFYLLLNGHLLGILLGGATSTLIYVVDHALARIGLSDLVSVGLVADWPFWGQFLVVFFFIDFLQWCIHNLLHRVPWLWEFHKTHHSIQDMDWIGHMRFHWVEGLIYRTLLYLPLTLLNIDPSVLLVSNLFSLGMGYFNHSNLDIDIGPLGYFFNNPRMHLWHHTHPECGPTLCNFGLNLALWDWIFGTAYQPREKFPERLGLDDGDPFPDHLWEQLIYPIKLKKGNSYVDE